MPEIAQSFKQVSPAPPLPLSHTVGQLHFGESFGQIMTCPICSWSPNNNQYRFVHETSFWRVVLAPNQCLLGRCILHLKRHAGDVAETTPAEVLDWLSLVAVMEKALRLAFGATMFNWSCYMNLSYRETPPNPHIHWWVVPRYEHPVKIGAAEFDDPRFGNPYDHGDWRDVSEETRAEIVLRLSQAISSQPQPNTA